MRQCPSHKFALRNRIPCFSLMRSFILRAICVNAIIYTEPGNKPARQNTHSCRGKSGMKFELSIELLRILCKENKIKWSVHAFKRIRERGIKSDEVINCIRSGEIIENYPTDYPLPSCLIYSFSTTHIHAVVSSDGDQITIITAYYPAADKWNDDFKTRRGQEE